MATDQGTEVDYVVVGAGSAGCVVANRLSEDRSAKVVVLEAGGDDRPLANLRQFSSNMMIHIPAGFAFLLTDPKATWQYDSEPDAVSGRVYKYPRGKVLGGSSSINGLQYVRGRADDFNTWRQLGCYGWGWDELLPLMTRIEDRCGTKSEFVGKGGEQSVSEVEPIGISEIIMEACVEAGIPRDVDINAGGEEGVSRVQMTARNGVRTSTAKAFLHPVSSRPNLQIVTEAFTTRILFEGRRAVGVEYRKNGQLQRVYARREVVLSAGPINSPKILLLSGVGPAEELKAMGITPIVDSPRVGKNLQDHYTVPLRAQLKHREDSINYRTHGLHLAGEVLKYAAFRRGVLSTAAVSVAGFIRTRPELDLPDIKFNANAGSSDPVASMKAGRMVMRKEPGVTLAFQVSRPLSRGEITLRSADPDVHPRIEPNFLSDPYDQMTSVAAMRRMRQIMDQPALAARIEKILPPADRFPEMTDDDILLEVRALGISSYHACGACEMGADAQSVVDPELRVRGVEGLRVADGSIMPRITSGNLNATCILIGAKCGELIKAGRSGERRLGEAA